MRTRLPLFLVWISFTLGCFNRGSETPTPKAIIEITPSTLLADGVTTAVIQACIVFPKQDQTIQGALTKSARLQFNSNRPSAGLMQPEAGPDNDGCFVGSIRSAIPGTQTLSASLIIDGQTLPLSATALVTFNDLEARGPGLPCACSSTLAANPNVISADGVTVTELVLTVLDSTGAPVPATPVTFVVSGTHNVLTDAVGMTGPDGILTATLASSTPETKTVTAHAGDMATTTQVAFTLTAPSQLNSKVVANPNTLSAGSTTTLTLTVQDALGRSLQGTGVTWASSGQDINFGSASQTTDAAGTAQTTLESTIAETKRVTATVGAARVSTSVLFQPMGMSQLAVYTGSGNGVSLADGSQSIALTAVPTDVYGNGVPAQAVTFSGVVGTVFAPSQGVTDGNGLLQVSATSTVAGAQNVNVTSAGLFGTATMTFIAGTAVTGSSSLTVNPNSLLADGQTSAAVSLTLRDGFNNPTPGVVIVLSASGTHNNIVPNSGVTDANGTFVGNMTSTYAENKTVLATFAGGTLDANVTFLHGNANSITSTLTADTNIVSADGTAKATLVTTVLDAFGNPVPNTPVAWSATGSSINLTPQATTTDANGQVTATLSSTVVQSSTVSAVVGSGATFTATLTVQFTSGAPSATTSTLVASPSSLTANGSSASTITMTLRDQGGNPLAGQSVTASTDGTSSTLTPLSGTTDGTGVFTATLTSTRAQTETVTVHAGGITKTATVTFVAGAPSATHSTFTASPNNLLANGGATSTLTFSVFDAQNNPVTSAAVTFASTGTSNTITPSVTTTNAAGVATATFRSTYAESKSVSAKSGGLTQTATVVFVAGAASNVTSTLVVNPNQQTADGSTVAITVTVLDANNNPLTGQTVNLASTGTTNVFTPLSGPTNSSGIFNATWSSTKAEAKALSATVAGITLNAAASFVAGAPTSAASSFTVNPTTLTADGSATSVLTVTLVDSKNNAVPAQAVTFATSGTNNTLAPLTTTTNASGIATATFASSTAEVKSVTAKSGALIQNASITFQAGSPNATMTTLTASPNNLAADGSSASTLTFLVLDAKGNPKSSIPVTISATGASNTLNPNTGNTDATGAFVSTLKSTTPETKVVTAVGAGITKNANVVFATAVVNAGFSTFTASPTTVAADGVSTSSLTVSARNGSNAAVVGAAVTFTSTGTAYTFSPASGVTDASGNFSATVASTKAETKTVTANVSGTNLNANVTFIAGNTNSTTSTFIVNPTSLTANGAATSALTMTLTDAFGNPVSGQAVTFASTGGNNTLAPLTTTTNTSGVATATLASIRAETKSVSASSGAISKSASVTFVAGAASSPNTTFTASPTNNITANNVATTTLTANVADAFGNPITGQSVSLMSDGSNDVFSPAPSGVTSAGVFTATLASTKAQVKLITATIGSY